MMKKFFFSMMLAAISLTSFAQQGGGQRREFKPEDQATRRANQVKEAAKTTDEQYQKVYDLFLKQAQESQAKMKEAQEKGERPRFDREEMQKQREATNAALKEILTEEQFAAYEKAQQERMQRGGRGGQGGRGQGGGRQRPGGGSNNAQDI
ncbi:MAG: hypothetical protein IKQ62_05665 [Bacteroidaceae bacterium]|nr:hypothetical protein [Bacteroidaceae bacterium]